MTLTRFLNEFFDYAYSHPDKPAVYDMGGSRMCDYAGFASIVGSIESILSEEGVGKGDCVAIRMGRIREHYAARIAALCLGAVPLSLNPDLPEERSSFIIEDCKARFVVDDSIIGRLREGSKPKIEELDDSEPGFVIYTSGTTGKPKGALHARASLESYIAFVNDGDIMHEDEVFGAVRDMMSMASLWCDMFTPFIAHGTVHILDEERKDLALLSRYYAEHGVTISSMNPNVVKIFDAPPGFRTAMVGGEPAFDMGGRDFRIINRYGATECVTMAFHKIDSMGLVPAGRPITGGSLILLNEKGEPAEKGEICYCGPGIMEGYLNLPEKTAKAIGKSPIDGSKMYHTGDIGLRNPDGTVTVIGRMDSMTKINGFRVEPSEVELTIRGIKGIVQAIVKPFRDGGTSVLCAYYISDKFSPEELRTELLKKLPSYMVPGHIVKVDAFQKNRNGKIDRALLTLPQAAPKILPKTEAEKEVCRAFSKVFRTDVGLEADFITLGGDSLRAMTLQYELGCRISASDILRLRSPSAIAGALNKESWTKWDGSPVPLSESQLNIYLDEMANDKGTAYNIPFTIRYPKSVSADELLAAVRKAISLHPMLSARVGDDNDLVFDCEPSVVSGECISVEPFDLHKGPLCRFSVTDTDDGPVLNGDVHHLVFDAESRGVLVRDIAFILSGTEPVKEELLLPPEKDHSEAERFFDSMLSGLEPTTLIKEQNGSTGAVSGMLKAPMSQVEEFCKTAGVTLGTMMAAAFGYTLSRYTGTNDPVFTTIVNGRDFSGADHAVGMYVRTLPISTDCSKTSVSDFLGRFSDRFRSAISHSNLPFRILAREYGVSMAVSFQYDYDLLSVPDVKGEKCELTRPEHDPVADLTFAVSRLEEGFYVRILHSDLLSTDTVRRFLESFDSVVSGMMVSMGMEDINYTSAADIETLDSMEPDMVPLVHKDIVSAFRQRASISKDSVYIRYMDRSYTFAEADRISDSIASALATHGVSAGDTVGVMVQRSEWYVMCALGVLKTGAAYVPIDTSYPDERVELMLSDSAVKTILVTPETEQRASFLSKAATIDCTFLPESGFEPVSLQPDDTAMILYTSGTTGRPKGTLITHLAIENYSEWMCSRFSLTEDDIIGMHSSIGFDAHIISLYPPIICGCSLDAIPEDIRKDMDRLRDHSQRIGMSCLFMTTQLAKMFLPYAKEAGLRILIAGGEKLGSVEPVEGVRFFDGYGPTENTVFTLTREVTTSEITDSLGVLLYNVKAYILDREHRRVPIGAIGELYVSGYQLSKGYLNNPERDAEAFFDNPFSEEYGCTRMYATGDYLRLLPDGTYGFIGRRDGQLKIRGNRVELTEVEACIKSFPGITNVSVQPIILDNGSKELCAYVVSDTEISAADVQSHVSERKPEYMVPAFVIQLDSIPTNVNGKVDRRALPKPDISTLIADYVAPRNEAERIVCIAIADSLGIDKIGIDDDFIRLGGDSLKAIRVASLCRSNGLDVSVQSLIAKRTVRQICPKLTEITDMGSYSGPLDLSPVQRLFMASGDKTLRDRFNQSMLLSTDSQLDVQTLQKAIDAITDHHDMLRAVFGDEPYVREPGVSVCTVDSFDAESEEEMTAIMDRLQGSMSLEEGRMIACAVIRHSDSNYLFLAIHHMVVDAASWPIIIDDLSSAYMSISKGESPKLPPRTLPYNTWVNESGSKVSESEQRFWRSYDVVANPERQLSATEHFEIRTDISLSTLRDNAYGVDAIDVLLAALTGAYREIREGRFSIRMEGHGRNGADVERTVGWFTDLYPLTLNPSGDWLTDLYSARQAFHSIPKGGVGYGLVTDLSEIPDITFNYLGTSFAYSNEMFRSVTGISRGSAFSDMSMGDVLSINVRDEPEGLVILGERRVSGPISGLPESFIRHLKAVMDAMDGSILSCPLSEQQLNVYLDEMAHNKSTEYNAPGALRLEPGTTLEAVQYAIATVCNAHPVLKGRVVEKCGIPWIVTDAEPEISRGGTAGFVRPFDLSRCMSRFRISDDIGMLYWDMHHTVMDATSRKVLISELKAAMKGRTLTGIDTGFMKAYAKSIATDPAFKEESEAFFEGILCDTSDSPRLMGDGGSYGVSRVHLNADCSKVSSCINDLRITKASLFTAAFAYTLSRFTGGSDTVFTVTDSGRYGPEVQSSIGMFIRTLPLHIDCTESDTADYLRRVSETTMGAMEHGDVPFRILSKRYDVDASVMFEYNQDLNSSHHKETDSVQVSDRVETLVASDFLFIVEDVDDGFNASLFHSDRYSERMCKEFIRAYDLILSGLLKNDTLSSIVYSEQPVGGINDTSVQLMNADIIDAFRKNVSAYPDSILLRFMDRSYTYADADKITDSIASALAGKGVSIGDSVSVLVPRSEWYLLCALGAMKTGAAYVPLDTAFPDERIQFMIQDTSSKVVLVTAETKERVSALTDAIVIDCTTVPGSGFHVVKVPQDTTGVVLYTSGTTGKPKGSQITRRAILNLSEWYCSYTNFVHGDTVGLHTSYVFDMHTMAMFPPLIVGATLDIIPEDVRLNMDVLEKHLEDHKVNHIFMTTQLGRMFAQAHPDAKLDVLFVAGEKLGEFDQKTAYRVYDGYGPSENLALSTAVDVRSRIEPMSVGYPNSNVKAYILDREHRPVPYGAVGELYLSGFQLSKGYLNSPKKNAESFFDNPFSSEEGYERMYATGDYFKVLPDGSLGVLGRRDGQLKIRGNRVELTEVETCIRSMPGITAITVQPVVNDSGGKELCAYYVSDDATPEGIQSYVAARKPDYMVPSFCIRLNRIPLNINGKVDKKALPSPDASVLRTEYVPPRDIIEEKLCMAFAQVLGLERVGIDDDFIRLGGDSLLAIKLQSICPEVFTSDILTYRTVRRIRPRIRQADERSQCYDIDSGCPLTGSLLNVYLDTVSANKAASYAIDTIIDVPEGWDAEMTEDVIRKFIDAYPVTKGRVADKDGTPWLVCDAQPDVRIVDICSKDEIRKPFDIEAGPLCRFRIVRGDHIIIRCAFHHTIFDGMSVAVLNNAFNRLFSGETLKVDDGFLRMASYESQMADHLEESAAFFRDLLADAESVPELAAEPWTKEPAANLIALKTTVKEASELASRMGITRGNLLISAFGYALSRFTGSDDVIFCTTVNGRDAVPLEDSIGMFVRTLPVRIDCSNRTVEGFLKESSDRIYDVISNQLAPFWEISRETGVNASFSFNYMSGIDYMSEDGRGGCGPVPVTDMVADLVFSLMEQDGGFLVLERHSAKYSTETIGRLTEVFDKVLEGMMSAASLRDIDYLPERDSDISKLYDTEPVELRYKTPLDAFMHYVSTEPDARLVSYKGRSITYAEADWLTDSIANALCEAGTAAGDRVAFLVPRSELYVICELAALKAGAAFVPLDEAHPDDRLQYMVKDSSSRLVMASPETFGRASGLGVPVIDVTAVDEHGFDIVRNDTEDPAVILYTSGTTGMPKGCVITNKNIISMSQTYCDWTGFDRTDIFGCYPSIGFDAPLQVFFSAIFAGGSIDIVPEDIRLDIKALADHIADAGITHIFMTTRVGRAFYTEISETCLKILMVGGESLGDIDPPSSYRMLDGYGPTENIAFSMVTDVDSRMDPTSVGRPNPNVSAYILDSELRPIPSGAVGELYLSGYQLSKGYLNNPEKNAEAYFDNPFSSRPGFERMYATGDYFRILPDGTLGVLGRRDGQVKIRGNRIELTEVESCISGMPGVESVAVIAIPMNGYKELCAYIVGDVDADSVRSYVASRKPDYMVPTFVIQVDSIPLTVNGKLDTRGLPQPDVSTLMSEYVEPRNDMERILCDAFQTTLNVERVGIDDDFSRLGGDSLKAIRVVSLCRAAGVEIKAKDVVAMRTVRALATVASVATDIESTVGPVGLTSLQKEYLDTNEPGTRGGFVQTMDLQCLVSVDTDVLEDALKILSDRHDMLRAIYDSEPRIRERGEYSFTLREITVKSDEELIDSTNKAFDDLSPEDGKLIVCLLFDYNGNRYVRLMIHHMVVDGVSWNTILSDFSECIAAVSEGRPPSLPPRTVPFRDWISSGYQMSSDEKSYWAKVPEFKDSEWNKEPFSYRMSNGPSSIPSEYGFETVDILMAAFARAFRRATGDDPVLRMEGHGRGPGVERTVGWFTCVYPLAVKTSDDPIVDVFFVRRARRAVPNGGRGYSYLDGVGLPRGITFNYLGSSFEYEDGNIRSVRLPIEYPKSFDLDECMSFNIVERDGVFAVSGECDRSLKLPELMDKEFNRIIADLNERPPLAPLSVPQLNIYLDEMVNDRGTAYSAPGVIPVPDGFDPEDVIRKIVEAHPVLQGRISEIDDVPYIITDSEPVIEHGTPEGFIRPFDLSKGLCRFRIGAGYILWDIHHAIMDAESRRVLISEFRRIFTGIPLKRETGFVISAVDSPDYDYLREAESYFASILDSEHDLPQPDGGDSPGLISLRLRIGPSDIQKLGVTPGGFFSSAFGYTLSRYSGSPKAVFPMTEKGRKPGTEDSIGMFVRTFPISIDCSESTVKEFLSSASETILGAMSHSAISFMDLAREYNVDMSVSFEYLSDINTEASKLSSENSTVTFTLDPLSDILLTVSQDVDGFKASLQHSGKYSDAFCKRFLESFSDIVSGFVSCTRLSEIDYISENDISTLDAINDTAAPLRYKDILEAFRHQVSIRPDSVLVTYLDSSYTYAESDRISDSIAFALVSKGIGKGDTVAIMVHRSEWYLLCSLAILKTGAAYVPIDTTYPDERVSHMLSDSDVKAILVTPDTCYRASSMSEATCIDCTSVPDSSFDPVEVSPDDTAIVLYTSGTTGKPKGSLVTRLAIENFCEWMCSGFSLTENDVVGMHSSFSFDAHLDSLYPPILGGCSLDIIPEGSRLDMKALLSHIVDAHITSMFMPTQLGKLLLSEQQRIPLKCLHVGGEALGDVDGQNDIEILDGYGPTENTACSMSISVKHRAFVNSVGLPNPNIKAYILDGERRRVPIGAIGELYLSGYQLSKGYLNNPEKNASAFFENPFSNEDGYERMYATGDYFRLLSDGTFGVLGRRDGQVKIRGNRVETTEVEACIRSIPGITDVTVQPIISKNGSKELCAYIISSSKINASDVQSFVSERKPDYMVPAFVIQLDSIPLTVNGKIDKRALPKPDMSSLMSEYVGPRNDAERILCEAIAETLDLKRIGIDDSFTKLGGDSLSAIRVISKSMAKGLTVSARDLIFLMTPRNIAPLCSLSVKGYDSVSGPCGLSPVMRSFMKMKNRDGLLQTRIIRLGDRIDIDALQKAVDALTDHHDMLRCVLNDGLSIRKSGSSVCTVRKAECPDAVSARETIRIAMKNIDLAEGRVMECEIISMPDCDRLFIAINHIAVDEVSWGIIIDDLSSAYKSALSDSAIELPARTMPFPEWIELLGTLESKMTKRRHDYWSSVIPNIRSLGETCSAYISSQTEADADNEALRFNLFAAKPEELILAAVRRAYRSVYGSELGSVAVESHGRDPDLGDVKRTVGWFTAMYPMLLKDSEGTVEEDILTTTESKISVPGIGLEFSVMPESVLPDVVFNYLGIRKGTSEDAELIPPSDGSVLGLTGSLVINAYIAEGKVRFDVRCGTDSIFRKGFESFTTSCGNGILEIFAECKAALERNTPSFCPSEPQLNVLLDEMKNENGRAQNCPATIVLPGNPDPEHAVRAVKELIEAHPILKARFSSRNGEPWMVYDAEPEIRCFDSEPDMSDYNKPFDMMKSLSRFWIVISDGRMVLHSNAHHGIFDLGSIDVLHKDVLAAYSGIELERDYGFITSADTDRRAASSSMYEKAEAQLDDLFADIDTDSRPLSDSRGGTPNNSMCPTDVDYSEMTEFCDRMKITPNAFFAAAFGYTLSRFNGMEDAVFCIMENGRGNHELKHSIGMFARILPICIRCSDSTISEFLKSASDRVISAMYNDVFPFRTAVKRYGISGSVQFQFIKANMDIEEDEEGVSEVFTDFDFNVIDTGESYILGLRTADIYSKELASRFLECYKSVLHGMMVCENLADIDLVSDKDIEIQDRINETSYPIVHKNVRELFLEAVRDHPDNIAVNYLDNSYTYREAERIASRIGAFLTSKGIGPGDLVGVLVKRSEWYYLAPMGVLASGAGYVPIDDAYPDERLIHMVNDSKMVCLLSSGELLERARNACPELSVYDIDTIPESDAVAVDIQPDDTAVILYTSGTTGKPKGSVITNRAIVNLSEWYTRYTKMTSEDRYGLYASIAFDMHTLGLFTPLPTGASLDIVPEDVRLDMHQLNRHFTDKGVTHTFITTQVGKIFASMGEPTTIHYLMYGGEKLGEFSAPDEIGACESYGPSENLALSTAIYVNDRSDPTSVGRLISNIKAYILDREKRRLPIGAVGELHLSGFQLSKGYLGNAELNAKVFLPNRFTEEKGYERIYSTGDFFRILPDGTFGVLGRRDGQVKIRGNRVELTEVENVIREMPIVDNVSVQVVVNKSGGKELCAYVVAKKGTVIKSSEIMSYVMERKPAYMVPSYVVNMPSIPLTVNCKVDRRALPPPTISMMRTSKYAPPRNESEKALCDIFSEVLNVSLIGIDDDFFALGGDSIQSIRIMAKLRSRGFEDSLLSPAEIMRGRTPRVLAAKLRERVDIPDIYDLESGCPLNDAQRNLYEYLKGKGDMIYNISTKVSDPMWKSSSKLKEILKELLYEIPILRSHIGEKNGEPWLFIDDVPDVPIVNRDPDEMALEFVRPFDIHKDPLSRFMICDYEGEVTLLMDIHHMAFDGASIHPLISRMIDSVRGDDVKIDTGFIKAATYDRMMKGTERYLDSKRMFMDEIEGCSIDYLPVTEGSQPKQTVCILSATRDEVKGYLKEHALSVNGFFACIMGKTLSVISGKDKCLFFDTHDGRGHIDLDNAVGLYAKSIPISISFEGKTIPQAIVETSDKLYRALDHDEFALWNIWKERELPWEIRFQYAYFIGGYAVRALKMAPIPRNKYPIFSDLWVRVIDNGQVIKLDVVNSKKYSEDTVRRFIETYDKLVLETIRGDNDE